jgi:hypothetical protein
MYINFAGVNCNATSLLGLESGWSLVWLLSFSHLYRSQMINSFRLMGWDLHGISVCSPQLAVAGYARGSTRSRGQVYFVATSMPS